VNINAPCSWLARVRFGTVSGPHSLPVALLGCAHARSCIATVSSCEWCGGVAIKVRDGAAIVDSPPRTVAVAGIAAHRHMMFYVAISRG
jgi:hypothetical protein